MNVKRQFARFIGSFALVYGLMIAPWPGFKSAYSVYLATLCRFAFGESRGDRILRFEHPGNAPLPIDTVITLANRDQVDAQGGGPAKMLELDARSIGWVPTAVFVALTLSTPVSRRRRALALVCGVALVHAYILFAVGCYIWNESTDLALVALTPFWKAVAEGLEETLTAQLGPSFAIPVLIWMGVTLRTGDLEALRAGTADRNRNLDLQKPHAERLRNSD